MKKLILLVLAVLLACPAAASATANQLYMEVIGITSETELECAYIYVPEYLEVVSDVREAMAVTVKVANKIPAEVMEAIVAQKMALIAVDHHYVAEGKTVIETESVRPAVYYGIITTIDEIDADANVVSIKVSNIVGYSDFIFPEDIDVPALRDQAPGIIAIRFSPYVVYESESYRPVYAKDVSFPACAYGFIAEISEDYLALDIYPFNNHAYPEIKNVDPPTLFSLTKDTLSAERLFTGLDVNTTGVIVIYDEETMEALALFFYLG